MSGKASGKKPKPAAKKPVAKKPSAKKPAAKKPAAKVAKKPARLKPVTGYVVVREVPADAKSYTAPTTVFATKTAAAAHAAALNAELRAVCNPFEDYSPGYAAKGVEAALLATLARTGAPQPQKAGKPAYYDWQGWWDASYFDMIDAQRDAVWDALTGYRWFEVQAVTVE
jgi:hypothetical protein